MSALLLGIIKGADTPEDQFTKGIVSTPQGKFSIWKSVSGSGTFLVTGESRPIGEVHSLGYCRSNSGFLSILPYRWLAGISQIECFTTVVYVADEPLMCVDGNVRFGGFEIKTDSPVIL